MGFLQQGFGKGFCCGVWSLTGIANTLDYLFLILGSCTSALWEKAIISSRGQASKHNNLFLVSFSHCAVVVIRFSSKGLPNRWLTKKNVYQAKGFSSQRFIKPKVYQPKGLPNQRLTKPKVYQAKGLPSQRFIKPKVYRAKCSPNQRCTKPKVYQAKGLSSQRFIKPKIYQDKGLPNQRFTKPNAYQAKVLPNQRFNKPKV